MVYIDFVMRGIRAAMKFFTYFLTIGGMMTAFVSVCGLRTTYRLFLAHFYGGGTEPND